LFAHDYDTRPRFLEDGHQRLLDLHPRFRGDVVRNSLPGVEDDERILHARQQVVEPGDHLVPDDELGRIELEGREKLHVRFRGQFREEGMLKRKLLWVRPCRNVDRIAFRVEERHELQGEVGLAGARVSLDEEDVALAAEHRLQFRRNRSQLSRRLVILNHLPRRPPAAPEYMNEDHLKACSNLVVTPLVEAARRRRARSIPSDPRLARVAERLRELRRLAASARQDSLEHLDGGRRTINVYPWPEEEDVVRVEDHSMARRLAQRLAPPAPDAAVDG